MNPRLITVVPALFLGCLLHSRTVRTINDNWQFTKEGKTVTVNLPHTWNAADTWDETPGFYRGICSYRSTVTLNDDLSGRRVYVRFEGANQETELLVNGRSVGRHLGGYTAFCFDVTDAVRAGGNDFLVKVDNSHNPLIAPLSADFTFYGGIYRDVELLILPENHISVTHFASSGVYITTPSVSETSSEVEVCTHLTLQASSRSVVRQEIFDPDGKMVASCETKVKTREADADVTLTSRLTVEGCRLWEFDDPALYRVQTTLLDAKGNELDRVSNPLGFRTFRFDPEEGFFLNGRRAKLMGTCRHQDYEGIGNALPDEMHVRDVRLLKEMGGNYLRIAHYPQDPIVLQMCQREGILASVEIPIVDYITPGQDFIDVQSEIVREMIYQNFNSPSVILWGYMNEVLLRPNYAGANTAAKRDSLFAATKVCAQALEKLVKQTDPTRPTLMCCNGDYNRYIKAGLAQVSDVLGWNMYKGWYGGGFELFMPTMESIHKALPDKPLLITEFGAGADPRLHSYKPEKFDFTLEYEQAFHTSYIRDILKTPWIAGGNVWNLADFYAEPRVDAVPHVNSKGLLSLDRTKKDSFCMFQAVLNSEPFLQIGGHDWKIRGGDAGQKHPVCVFSNAREVELFLNGKSVGVSPVVQGVANFGICFKAGRNVLKASASFKDSKVLEDVLDIEYQAVPEDMSEFRELNVMLGGNRFFEVEENGVVWIPEKEYEPGSWGYIGGKTARPKTGNDTLPCSNADILGTELDPLYQSQRVGIGSFKADVPDGQYYVYLHFAELSDGGKASASAYNLGNDVISEGIVERVFNVSINGTEVLHDFNLRQEYGALRAVERKFTAEVSGGRGLSIDFSAVAGSPVLNAVRIYRCL